MDGHPTLKKLFHAAGILIVGGGGGAIAGLALATDVGGAENVLVPVCAAAGALIATYYAIKNLREPGLT